MTARAIVKIAAMKRDETALKIGATGGVGTSHLPLLSHAGGTHRELVALTIQERVKTQEYDDGG
ncbi:hypothetical protein U1707_17650 [Sphingomonas sp. PB2P12]|uniref:hypothetical protein n=1 Tax=Sphingomonas sandaracina TaxID=3096157 RepID=UPI002FC65C33